MSLHLRYARRVARSGAAVLVVCGATVRIAPAGAVPDRSDPGAAHVARAPARGLGEPSPGPAGVPGARPGQASEDVASEVGVTLLSTATPGLCLLPGQWTPCAARQLADTVRTRAHWRSNEAKCQGKLRATEIDLGTCQADLRDVSARGAEVATDSDGPSVQAILLWVGVGVAIGAAGVAGVWLGSGI